MLCISQLTSVLVVLCAQFLCSTLSLVEVTMMSSFVPQSYKEEHTNVRLLHVHSLLVYWAIQFWKHSILFNFLALLLGSVVCSWLCIFYVKLLLLVGSKISRSGKNTFEPKWLVIILINFLIYKLHMILFILQKLFNPQNYSVK